MSDTTDVHLTTVDNPHDPFNSFDAWLQYDVVNGYNSLGLIARIAHTSSDLPDSVQRAELERVIDEIVELNISGMHKKVSRKG